MAPACAPRRRRPARGGAATTQYPFLPLDVASAAAARDVGARHAAAAGSGGVRRNADGERGCAVQAAATSKASEADYTGITAAVFYSQIPIYTKNYNAPGHRCQLQDESSVVVAPAGSLVCVRLEIPGVEMQAEFCRGWNSSGIK